MNKTLANLLILGGVNHIISYIPLPQLINQIWSVLFIIFFVIILLKKNFYLEQSPVLFSAISPHKGNTIMNRRLTISPLLTFLVWNMHIMLRLLLHLSGQHISHFLKSTTERLIKMPPYTFPAPLKNFRKPGENGRVWLAIHEPPHIFSNRIFAKNNSIDFAASTFFNLSSIKTTSSGLAFNNLRTCL